MGSWGVGAGGGKKENSQVGVHLLHAVPESLLDGGERPGTKRGRRSERGRTRGLSGPVVTGPMEHPAPGGGTPGPVLLASGGGARGAAGWGEGGGRESCREMAEFVPPSVAGSRTPRPGRARQVVEGVRTPPASGRQPAPPEGLPPPDTVQAGADPGSANAQPSRGSCYTFCPCRGSAQGGRGAGRGHTAGQGHVDDAAQESGRQILGSCWEMMGAVETAHAGSTGPPRGAAGFCPPVATREGVGPGCPISWDLRRINPSLK